MSRLIATALTVALLATAGCAGGSAPSPPTATAPAGDVPSSGIDVLFLSMMVAHTTETLEIVRLGRARATDAELRTLVAAIEVTEADELATMRRWLSEVGPSAQAAAARHDHSGHSDAPAGLARLRAAPADQVDRVLREVLGAHQRTAADLARAQVRAGVSERVRDLARRIERSRTAEVALMATPAAARR
ncbi:DUF305 domain-containing protein [Micromonospora coxensis]|uniref:DUF305 domain-containing protein n=1 Tax=Micromonospora coxensis TaxID=356852 RepID=UPI003422C9AC